jgi:acid phosphatase
MASNALRRAAASLLAALLGALGVAPAAAALPRPAHVVVVIEENHTLAQIVASGDAPYLATVAHSGALFTHAYGVTHPSQPNYFALLSGRMNVNGDGCPARGVPRDAPNLASELLAAHLTFAAYSESLPAPGFMGCSAGTYAQKHAPWVHFTNIPQRLHRPLDALRSFDDLATVTFVVPNVDDDMHDGSVAEGDAWAAAHLAPLLRWAATHDTLVIFTWDEGYDRDNSIPTMFVGPMVRPGRYPERIDHVRVLRTLEDLYGLAPTGAAAHAAPIVDVWR